MLRRLKRTQHWGEKPLKERKRKTDWTTSVWKRKLLHSESKLIIRQVEGDVGTLESPDC